MGELAQLLDEGVLERAARGVWGTSTKPGRYTKCLRGGVLMCGGWGWGAGGLLFGAGGKVRGVRLGRRTPLHPAAPRCSPSARSPAVAGCPACLICRHIERLGQGLTYEEFQVWHEGFACLGALSCVGI